MRVGGGIVGEEGIERRVEGLDLLAIVVEGVRVERGEERVARRRDGGGHFAHGMGQTVAEEVRLHLGVRGVPQCHEQGVEGCGGREEHEGQRALRGVGDGLAAALNGQRRSEPCCAEECGVAGEERKGERRGIDGDGIVNGVVGVSVVGDPDGGLLHVEEGLREEEGGVPTVTAWRMRCTRALSVISFSSVIVSSWSPPMDRVIHFWLSHEQVYAMDSPLTVKVTISASTATDWLWWKWG